MRLLTLLTFASGALALAIGPVHRPADQQAVDDEASLNLEKAVLADHEITRHDESLEKRALGISMPGIGLPRINAPAAAIFNGLKITYTMALHWVKKDNGEWVYEYYVQSLQLLNQLNRRISVEIVSAGKMLFDQHMNQLGEGTARIPEGTKSYDLYISELNTEL
ncbi:hypothetical protein E4U13_005989 [Claviceps humidiphila]|uniref:Uncharacterized protein n=1 Tax=Claviceps humidiphila TaxID=1294629 RepID=A0A9P7Q5C1_9HYPO|nr:hypothetical protein E4U32_000448 [Claviceps aff. humidiphila group G2b]KAG6120773.1 hypothetical protein E4U13_005989 [Claviceps humidiphila]